MTKGGRLECAVFPGVLKAKRSEEQEFYAAPDGEAQAPGELFGGGGSGAK